MTALTNFLQINSGWHRQFRRRKDQLFAPMVWWCHRHHISANTLSWIGLLIGLAGVPVLWFNYWWFVIIELVSAWFDVLDGASARLNHTVSEYGKQLDYTIDMTLCFVLTGAAIIWLNMPWLVVIFDVYGVVLLLNWLAGSPLYIAPGRMTFVLFSVLGVPWLGILIGIPYAIIMLGLLAKHTVAPDPPTL